MGKASSRAAITWDSQQLTENSLPAGSGTKWWFDPANWSAESPATMAMASPYYLPPNNSSGAITDTQINVGTASLDGGEGVVYDPANDPNFPLIAAHPTDYPFPPDFNAQLLRELYISRAQTNIPQVPNLLTIKGNLEMNSSVIVGRSSAEANKPGDGRINQLSGIVKMNFNSLDIAGTDTSATAVTSYGNGIYDYRGGKLEVSLQGGAGIRLSPSSGSVGAGGTGSFIVRNPGTPGYVRAYDFIVASGAGSAARPADGINTGVGIVEFHSSGATGTRPVQVGRNLSINNGLVTAGTRSSRLNLVLDSAPSVDAGGIPQNLGLFDVDFDQTDIDPGTQLPIVGNNTTGSGDLGDFFSSADATTVYTQDSIVTAMFAGSTYKWKISYTGDITWSDADASVVGNVSGTGGGDVVLIGDSSIIVPQGVAGDYNNNGVVDAADYVLWRNGGPIQNEVSGTTPGSVTPEDYAAWRARFGNNSGAGSAAGGAVPETSTCLMLLSVVICAGLGRRGRNDF
jgi:hypothetical protein